MKAYAPFPEEFPVLRGSGLTLRALDEPDLAAWFERLRDSEAASLAGDPVAASMQVVEDGLAVHRAAFRDHSGLRWAIVPDDVGVSVGSIGFVGLDPEARSAELGAAIGRAHWGRGIARRAAQLSIAYGFETLVLERVEAVILPENQRSKRALERLGFVQRNGSCPVDRRINEREDCLVYSLERGGV